MKAYIKEEHEHEKKRRFDGHKYRLTVGLVVKNEEKRIRRCLDAMKPLLDAVPSELVITDTGSTDNTIEILKEYTDKIYSFPWNGNISDARNICVKAAQGEWYLSMDADEWFENVDEIIEFFNSGECDKYGCASYIIRNYLDLDGKNYATQHAARMARIYEKLHYEGRIHDAMIDRLNPAKELNSYAHHYGYAYANEEQHRQKFERNLIGLKKDIEEFPTDLRYVYQIIKEYSGVHEYDIACDWCQKGLAIEKEYPDRMRRLEIYVLLLKLYYSTRQYQKAVDKANQILESEKEIEVCHIDIIWILMLSYIMLQKQKETISAGLAFLDIYSKFIDGKLSRAMLVYGGVDSATPECYSKACFAISKANLQLEQYQEAAVYFDKCDMSILNTIVNPVVLTGLEIAVKTEKLERITQLYQCLQQTKDENKQRNFIEVLENYITQSQDKCKAIVEQFTKLNEEEPYILLNKLRAADANTHGRDEEVQIVDWFIQSFKDWNLHYADVLYFAMKCDMDITPFIKLLDVEDLQFYTGAIIKNHLDFANVIIYYFLKHSMKATMKGKYWSICLREHVVISSDGMNYQQYVAYFKSYAQDLSDYAHSLYRPELFAEDQISVLPRAYRFGHYMGLAFEALKQGNIIEYIKNLKIALKCYSVMKEPIQVLMNTIEKLEDEQEENRNNEFNELAVQVKQKIEQLLVQGNLDGAKELTNQLAEMLPDDLDVKRYQLSANGKMPTLNQIMQDLPQ